MCRQPRRGVIVFVRCVNLAPWFCLTVGCPCAQLAAGPSAVQSTVNRSRSTAVFHHADATPSKLESRLHQAVEHKVSRATEPKVGGACAVASCGRVLCCAFWGPTVPQLVAWTCLLCCWGGGGGWCGVEASTGVTPVSAVDGFFRYLSPTSAGRVCHPARLRWSERSDNMRRR